jgi:hypothetical protein
MHVKKLSIALAKQYRAISIRLLFFSISSARPVGNVASTTSGVLQLWKILKSRHVHAHAEAQYTERNRLDLAVPRRFFPIIG